MMIDHRAAVEHWITTSAQKDAVIKFPNSDEISNFLATNYGMFSKEAMRPFSELLYQFCKDEKCPYPIDFTNYNEWYKELNIEGITFERELKGWKGLENVEVQLSSCTFEKPVTIEHLSFHQEISFNDSQFQQDVIFYSVQFYKIVNFDRTQFHKKVDVILAQFHKNLYIFEPQLHKKMEFSACQFHEGSALDNIKTHTDTHLSFFNTYTCPLLEITNTSFNGHLSFNGDNFEKLNLKGSIIAGRLSCIMFEPKPANWETAVILKHEEIKRNNVIEALRYKAIEKDLYSKELEAKKKSLQEWGECLALKMSWLSNNHGQDWLRALAFTLLSPLIPFLIFYAPMPSAGWLQFATQYFGSSQWMGELIKYFIPTNYDLLTAYASSPNINGWLKAAGGLIFLLGKILIVYGGVEVVQAFRKYNKNPS